MEKGLLQVDIRDSTDMLRILIANVLHELFCELCQVIDSCFIMDEVA